MTSIVSEYSDLIQRFLDRRISVKEFEKFYLRKFKDEKSPLGDELFELLDWLFAEVDAYTDLPIGPDEDATQFIDEDQLRESAAKVLVDLKRL